MKYSLCLILLSIAFVFVSCKKDKDDPPAFSATGYWKGVLDAPSGINLLNYPNGASRLYITYRNVDTSDNTTVKANGTWKVENGRFTAHFPMVDLIGAPPYFIVGCEASLAPNDTGHLRGVGYFDGENENDASFDLNLTKVK